MLTWFTKWSALFIAPRGNLERLATKDIEGIENKDFECSWLRYGGVIVCWSLGTIEDPYWARTWKCAN